MTQTATHTPGPWKIMQCLPRVPDYPGQTETVIVDSDNRNVLNRDLFEEAANALLIAAAPALLEACEAFHAAWQSELLQPRTAETEAEALSIYNQVERLIVLCQAAIAKAKGERAVTQAQEVYVECVRCGARIHFALRTEQKSATMNAHRGWRHIAGLGFCCPKCAADAPDAATVGR